MSPMISVLRLPRMPTVHGHAADLAVIDHLNPSPATASAGTTMADGFSRKMMLASTDMPIRSGVSCGSRR